ncbi:MAG: immunoglobulin domain-containing protein [Phycisphaerales bacterium]
MTFAPSSQTAAIGATVTFGASALSFDDDAPTSVQWLKDGVELVDGPTIPGATTPVLTLFDVSARSAGTFALRITNDCGEATTTAAMLTISCLGDLDANGAIDATDLGMLLAAWGTTDTDSSRPPCVRPLAHSGALRRNWVGWGARVNWDAYETIADLDHDGVVGTNDLAALIAAWGGCSPADGGRGD